MPLIMIDWLEGRSLEQKREIAKQVTEVVVRLGKVDPQAVRIFFTEHTKEQYSVGGTLLCDQ